MSPEVPTNSSSNENKKSYPAGAAKAPQSSSDTATIEVRDPDALQQGVLSFWHWLENNSRIIVALIAVAAVGAVAVSVGRWFQAGQEKKAQDAFYTVEAKFGKIKDEFEAAKLKAAPAKGATKEAKQPELKQASGDLEKDYGTLVGDIEKVARDFAGTSAGTQAAILGAETYVAYGQFDKAIAIGKLAVENSKNDSLVGTLAKIQLGSTFAIKGDCGEATKVWGDVLANKTMSAMHAEVSLKSGLCFEKLGEVAKATDMYQRAVTTAGPESATASTARGLLRALELKAQK